MALLVKLNPELSSLTNGGMPVLYSCLNSTNHVGGRGWPQPGQTFMATFLFLLLPIYIFPNLVPGTQEVLMNV